MQLQPKLKKYRLEKGLTQREIGKMLGIYHHAYATHERAGDIPKKYAVILAEYYGVGVDELYGFIEILDGNDFKEMREKHGYRQSDLMEVLGFKSQTNVSALERGVSDMTTGVLDKLAVFYNEPIEAMYRDVVGLIPKTTEFKTISQDVTEEFAEGVMVTIKRNLKDTLKLGCNLDIVELICLELGNMIQDKYEVVCTVGGLTRVQKEVDTDYVREIYLVSKGDNLVEELYFGAVNVILVDETQRCKMDFITPKGWVVPLYRVKKKRGRKVKNKYRV